MSGWSVPKKLDILDEMGLIYWPPSGEIPQFKRYLNEEIGISIVDVITDINPIGAQAKERLGYPTQKPCELLDRIISASSNPGDVVLDPFCGCGTAIAAAQKLGRQWVGIDNHPPGRHTDEASALGFLRQGLTLCSTGRAGIRPRRTNIGGQ